MEIIVDCYNESETWTGWYCYLENNLAFPFEAECIKSRKMSPLKPGERGSTRGAVKREAETLTGSKPTPNTPLIIETA